MAQLLKVSCSSNRDQRVNPDNVVSHQKMEICIYRTAEIVHAAMREKITTIFINNAIYGMTSGQMAPTTLINQVNYFTFRT